MTFVNEKLESGHWQTIDKERNIYLEILYVGDFEEPWKLNLRIADEDLSFDAYLVLSTSEILSGIVIWNVVSLHIPTIPNYPKDELIKILEKALHCYGRDGSTNQNNKDVVVKLPSNIYQVE